MTSRATTGVSSRSSRSTRTGGSKAATGVRKYPPAPKLSWPPIENAPPKSFTHVASTFSWFSEKSAAGASEKITRSTVSNPSISAGKPEGGRVYDPTLATIRRAARIGFRIPVNDKHLRMAGVRHGNSFRLLPTFESSAVLTETS